MFKKKQTLLYPPVEIKRKAPKSLQGTVPYFLKNVPNQFNSVNLYVYENVNLTPEGIVFRFLNCDKDLLIYPNHTKTYNFLYLASSLVKRKRISLPSNEKYLLCFDYWSNGIFHWLCDVLPRIEAVKDQCKDWVFLLPEEFQYPYILETLKAFQFKNVLRINNATYVHCKTLYAPAQISTSGNIRPDNMLSLRKTLLAYFTPAFNGRFSHPKLYISRNKAKYRKVLNEEELLPVLDKFGFKLIFFEDYTVSEQIELCFQAKTIVSIHGANLTNIAFMQPGGSVVEFRKKNDLMNNYYYELADAVGCNYYYLECDAEDPEPTKNTFSLFVKPVELESLFAQINSDQL